MVRVTGVVRTARKPAANDAIQTLDPSSVGDIFIVPLRQAGDATNTRVAWGMSWGGLPDDAWGVVTSAFTSRGFHPQERSAIPLGNTPNMARDLWLFEEGWEWVDALAALGFDLIERGQ